jgi:hypothetical protein
MNVLRQEGEIMKKVICLILLAMFLGTGAVPSLAQYRKRPSEMSDAELNAFIRAQRDKFDTYTKSTRALLSSFIGQDINLGLDGMALLKRYFPHTLAATGEKFDMASDRPIFVLKAEEGGGGFGWADIKDAASAAFAMVTFGDEQFENAIEQDLFNIYRDQQAYPNDRIEAMAENTSDVIQSALATYLRIEAESTSPDMAALLNGGAALLDLYTSLEATMEHNRRKQLRGYLWPGGPRPGPARGAPTGQPGPQGSILGSPGGNGANGRVTISVTEGGCVHITYDANNNPIITIVPCG